MDGGNSLRNATDRAKTAVQPTVKDAIGAKSSTMDQSAAKKSFDVWTVVLAAERDGPSQNGGSTDRKSEVTTPKQPNCNILPEKTQKIDCRVVWRHRTAVAAANRDGNTNRPFIDPK
jgi:hypothetical protein